MATWKNVVPSRVRQHEMKREALMREAAASFNRRGFHATSLEELAANLGVTKAALYYYFPNKHKVLLACFESAMEAAFRGLERAKREGSNGREKLRLALKYYLESMIDELSCGVILTEEHAVPPEDLVDHLRERDRYERTMRALVAEGIKDGSIVPCDPKLVTFTMLGAIHWVTKWFSHSGLWSGPQLAEAMTQLLDRSISSSPVPALARDVGAVETAAAPEPSASVATPLPPQRSRRRRTA